MEIVVYDMSLDGRFWRRAITRLGIGKYTLSKYNVGAFEITLSSREKVAVEFIKDRILLIDRRCWGVITGKKLTDADSGTITIFGKQLTDWIDRRIIIPGETSNSNMPIGYDSISGSTETVMKHYINKNMVNPDNPSRRFARLEIVPDKNRGIADDAYSARFVNLLTTVIDIGKRAHLGIDMYVDELSGRVFFDILPRFDRTAENGTVKPLVLRMRDNTLSSMEYIEEDGQSRNTFYCSRAEDKYEWETLTQTYFLDGDQKTGYERREVALSISTADGDDPYMELEKNAMKDAENYRTANTLTCEISNKLLYGRDYKVGDYGTVLHEELGILANMEIISYEFDNTSGHNVGRVTFGEPVISKFQRIERRFGQT